MIDTKDYLKKKNLKTENMQKLGTEKCLNETNNQKRIVEINTEKNVTEEGKQKNKRCMKEYLKIYRKNRSSNLLKKVKEDNALRMFQWMW